VEALLTEAELEKLAGVERIHLVFKTHFDLGFTDLAARVRARYLDDYLPRALELARRSRDEEAHRFVWTVASWLVYESLEHGSPMLRARLEQAIADGDITWTATPFTPHSELMGRELFALGLDLSRRLDGRFAKHTIAANLTDVPGHTIGIVPLLAAAGVRFLHVGVNPASPLPDVPMAFRWRMPDRSAEIAVAYDSDYGGVTRFGSSREAMLMVFTDDNVGPPDHTDVGRIYRELEELAPGAEIDATGMNAFAAAAAPAIAGLPVVERELGDSWLHGGATDPAKLAAYRELVRLRRDWLSSGTATANELDAAYRELMLVAEHTWGLDVKSHADGLEESWAEQRAYVEQAVERLPQRLAPIARARLQAPPLPDDLPWGPVRGGTPLEGSGLEVAVVYQAFDTADYARFHREYLRSRDPWALADFGKPGLETSSARSGSWTAECAVVRSALRDGATVVRRKLRFPDGVAPGAPRSLFCDLTRYDDRELEIVLRWSEKDPVRTPEAMWLTFELEGATASGWTLDKLGVPISPLDVDPRGGQLHAIELGVRYADAQRSVEIEMPDTPIVSCLGPRLLRFDGRRPQDGDGISVCLFNNVWGTNFPQWYGEPGFARFVVRIAP
jgi:hypothetical protein